MVQYRVIVDRNTCIGCGVAPNICSQVFELGDDNGKNRVIDQYSEKTSEDISIGVIEESLYNCIKEASDACPVQAITIEE
ncbi:MAG: ferredoxin [Candidatus Bathyarchaeota archaeon]|nr:MAG: ferredoxin [Candidatus Bathyarchaeota archaeon]